MSNTILLAGTAIVSIGSLLIVAVEIWLERRERRRLAKMSNEEYIWAIMLGKDAPNAEERARINARAKAYREVREAYLAPHHEVARAAIQRLIDEQQQHPEKPHASNPN